MEHKPTYLEILLTKLVFVFFGKSVYRSFAETLPLNGEERVLDFGCGMGTVAYHTAKRLPRGNLTCVDISERWLSACRKTLRRFGNVNFLKWGTGELAHESFDVVFCHFVLHDIPDGELEKVIPALSASLKPGGFLVFREPLSDTKKINAVKRLIEQNSLTLKSSRVTDIPLAGTAIESVYVKE